MWVYFNLFLVLMLALDLGMFSSTDRKVSFRQSLSWSFLWIALALLFSYGIYHFKGAESAMDFLTGYVIEKSLSVDNIFLIVLIFQYFAIPDHLQHKVLLWGVIGALIMRAGFIVLGAELIIHLQWIVYLFGGILLFTGVKMVWNTTKKADLGSNILIKVIERIIPVSSGLEANKFFTRSNGRTVATPLFLCLIVVEVSDLIFAIDSIPAILAITTDEFIVYSSNAFAILGLRSLYFSVSGLTKLFAYLHYALALILTFVGIKMLISGIYHIPTTISLIIILAALGLSIIFSMLLNNESLRTTENE